MKIAFSGASATGKSTAARKLAARLGYDFIPSKAAHIAEFLKFDINSNYSFEELYKYQVTIINHFDRDLELVGDDVVFDRSPLDFYAYLAEGVPDTIDIANDELVDRYFKEAKEIANNLDLIVLISPPKRELLTNGVWKVGRKKEDTYPHRLMYDLQLRSIIGGDDGSLVNKVLIMPEEIQFDDRVTYIEEKLHEIKR